MSDLYKNILNVQLELNVPKNQYSEYGNYYFRSCEDILEAVKPLCSKYGLLLTINDEIESCNERVYVKSTATVINIKDGEKFSVSSSAREAVSKTKFDDAQITGATITYARKNALGGLFAVDDNKDSDGLKVPEKNKEKQNKSVEKKEIKLASKSQVTFLCKLLEKNNVPISQICKNEDVKTLDELNSGKASKLINHWKKQIQ